jgi:hypothetical protein
LNQISEPKLIKVNKQSPNTSLAISISNTLFRDLKLNHHILTALDVDNSLYLWGLTSSDISTPLDQLNYPNDLIKPKNIKEIVSDASMQ